MVSKIAVEERGTILIISLTMDKKAIADNSDAVKEILQKYKFHAIKRGENFYAVSASVSTGRNYLHRLVLGTAVVGRNVTHKDGNSLNCCISNLLVKTTRQLLADAKHLRNPIVGIHKRRNGWLVAWYDSVCRNRRYKLFSTKYTEPGRAYELAVRFRLDRHGGSPMSM